ncbi:MAG: hypothetical protein D4R73_06340 [Deltaproteobacteria bacterium]|nr:MAG: hypothetical protein D4R73_06340 [Deltaproteobacteria bacterium]
MKMKRPLTTIKDCIDRIGKSFSDNSALYFSESDLQSELFSFLLHELPSEGRIPNTSVWGTQRDPVLRPFSSRALHTELLLPEGRIDLAILDLDNVTVSVNSRGRFGHLQLQDGDHVFIEIKASRTNRSQITSKPAWVKSIRSDIVKLGRYGHPCFMLCFDFSGILSNTEIEGLKAEAKQNVEIRYFVDPCKDHWFHSAETANHAMHRIADKASSR